MSYSYAIGRECRINIWHPNINMAQQPVPAALYQAGLLTRTSGRERARVRHVRRRPLNARMRDPVFGGDLPDDQPCDQSNERDQHIGEQRPAALALRPGAASRGRGKPPVSFPG